MPEHARTVHSGHSSPGETVTSRIGNTDGNLHNTDGN